MSVTEFSPDERQAIRDKWTLPRFVYWPFGLAAIAAVALSWPIEHWAWISLWTLIIAYAYFCWTSCFHETAHMTLVKSRTINIWLGRLLGFFMFTPYSVYRESHIRHHAYLNKPNDWELWPYADPKASKAFRRAFVWFDLVLGFIAGPIVYGRIFFHRDSPLKDRKLRRTIWLEYLGCVLFWGAVFTTVGVLNQWLLLVKVWLVPYAIAGVIQSGRKLTEHLGMASYDPLMGTRTVVGDNWITRLCTFVNFDIFVHGLHHRHPRMAHNQLAPKMRQYAAAEPDRPYPLFRTYWRATWNMLPCLIRNPGVGMNAGAPDPDPAVREDVDNFLGDVNEELLAPVERD